MADADDEFTLTPPEPAPPRSLADATPEERRRARHSATVRRRVRRKLAMRGKFGPGPADALCRTCTFFTRHRHHAGTYSKCEKYGISASDATDWSGKWAACGLYRRAEQ